jgi:hypothetical protein
VDDRLGGERVAGVLCLLRQADDHLAAATSSLRPF